MTDSPPHPSGLLKAFAACAKWSLWLLATFWLLLALAWGALHGWIVPRIGEFRPALESRASRVLGVPVRIAAISARSEGLIPTLELQGVVLLDPQGREALRLPRVVAALSPRSLWNLGFEQLYIERPDLDIRRAADGRFFVAGLDFSRGSGGEGEAADWFLRQTEFVIRGGTLHWADDLRGAAPLSLTDVDLVMRNSVRRHAMRLDATPPPEWGDRFSLRGLFRQPLLSTHPGRWQEWEGQVHGDFARVDVSQLRRHANLGVEVASGRGALRAWADVSKGQVIGGAADLVLADVSTTLAPGLQPLALASMSGRLGGKRSDTGFEFEARQLQFQTAEGLRWPGGDLFVSWDRADGKRAEQGELRADRLDLAALSQVAGRLPLGAATHAALTAYAPAGMVDNLQARWQGPVSAPVKYEARGRASRLQIAAQQPLEGVRGRPGIRGAALDFDFNEGGGKASLALQAGALEFPGVFEEPVLAFDQLGADLQWQVNAQRTTVNVNNLKFSNADAQGEAQGSWRTGEGADRLPGVLDLQASLQRADGTRVWRYLPNGVPKATRDYVRQAITQAEVAQAKFRVKGNLREFPFARSRQGEFQVTAQVRNAIYAFAPHGIAKDALPWPALTQLSAELLFERNSLRIKDANGRFTIGPSLRVKASAEIADLTNSTVMVTGEVRGPLSEQLAIVNQSPLATLTNQALAKATAGGAADLRLQLALPLAQIDRSRVLGTVTLAGNDVQITPDSPALSRTRGVVTFHERGFNVAGAQARALGGDARVDGGSRPGAAAGEAAIQLRIQGNATAEGLRQARELGFLSRLARHATGGANYNAVLSFRRGVPEVLVTSNLQGLALNLPAPLNKPADAALPIRFENALLRESAAGAGPLNDQLVLEIGRVAAVTYVRDVSGTEPRVVRGGIGIGLAPGESAPLPDEGVLANINLATVNLDAWEDVLEGAAAPAQAAAPAAPRAPGIPAPVPASMGYLPTTLAVRARELTAGGRTLHEVVVGGSREGLLWRANVDARELNGYVEYGQPSGTGAGRVYARLARLSIAAAQATQVEALLDEQPGNIPALDIVVDDFELRGRKLGKLEIDAVNRGAGTVARDDGVREWRLNKLSLSMPEAVLSATGNWAAIDAQAVPAGGPRAVPRPANERRRTLMSFKFDIQDSGGLLARFGMKDVVRRGRGRMEGQLAWLGSPLTLDYPSMTGTFHVNVENGQFLKADPGLAKLLGVLSLQSLPRRLTLDFRDVFTQGFAFDFVRGDITVQQGIAATNNLQMKGVNAAVLMEGKADIARETQDIRVVVVPEINAGTASLVATVINPAIGLGTFLAQMFLREPLARAATQQFQIDGTWADPRITRVPRQGAADTKALGSN